MIEYYPEDLLRDMVPKKSLERLVTRNLTLNKTVLNFLARSSVLPKKRIEEVALRVIRTYKARYLSEVKAGLSKSSAVREAMNGAKLMVQRVQNALVYEVAKDIRKEYRGDFYKWLPSSAIEADPLHQLNYGKVFRIGRGEMPGDRYGCQCGMQILVKETELEL